MYFERIRLTKAAAAVAGSSRGHVSAARTDPDTRDPPDSLHFLSQALVSSPFGAFFQVLEEEKSQSIQKKSQCVFPFLILQYLYQILLCAFVSSCQYAIFFGFIFVLAFYLVLCIEMREVYWK